jgi:hypothetical protein
VWLLDAVLQLQPFMFTRGANGFSGMLNGVAQGNPAWIAHTIRWNASNVYHHPIWPTPCSPASSSSWPWASCGSEPKLDGGLALVVAFILLASAIFTLASPVKGRSHFGSHAPAYAPQGPGSELRGPTRDGASGALVGMDEAVAAPWLVDVSHVVMCIAMALMLILLA